MPVPPSPLFTDPSTPALPPTVRREAVAWLMALQADSASDETRDRWRQWRDAHPDHERAWRRVEHVGGALKTIPSPVAHAALAAPRYATRRHVLGGLAVALVAGGAGWAALESSGWQPWTADARTGPGERRDLVLADGTQVQLDTATAVDVHFSARERVLRLLHGQILVATAPDPNVIARPFIVETRHGRLRALGTRFNVRDLEGQEGHVAVFEGAVEIRPTQQPRDPRRLPAGQQARFTSERVAPPSVADAAASAWTEGMLVAQDMPLGDFLAELGRHRRGRLSCDPAVAGLRVSGTYPLADSDRVLAVLAATLPVKVRRITSYWVSVLPAAS